MSEHKFKIISGGQTGVDRGALDAALALGVSCGGWCPLGRKAEDGPIDQHYPLQETPTADYLERTRFNVRDSDGTLIIYFAILEGGTARTEVFCKEFSRPYLLLDMSLHDVTTAALMLEEFVKQHQISRLNVAGPRASKQPDASMISKQIVMTFLGNYLNLS